MEEAVASRPPPSNWQRHLAPAYRHVGSEEKGEACIRLGRIGISTTKPTISPRNCRYGMDVILDMVGGDYRQRIWISFGRKAGLVYIQRS